MDDIFVPVPGVPGVSASAAGKIRGKSGRVLADFPDRRGRRKVTIYVTSGRWRQYGVHTLVCLAFHGERPPGAVVAHNNGNGADNRAANLRWSTPWQNEADKREHGTALLGERHHQAKLTEADVRAIRASTETGVVLAARYGVTPANITSVRKRRTWAGVV